MPKKTEMNEMEPQEAVQEAETQQEAETKKPAMDAMVEIFMQKERGLNAKKDITINVNGKDFKIELGKKVNVPYYVYLAILSRENDRDFEDDFIRLNSRADL